MPQSKQCQDRHGYAMIWLANRVDLNLIEDLWLKQGRRRFMATLLFLNSDTHALSIQAVIKARGGGDKH